MSASVFKFTTDDQNIDEDFFPWLFQFLRYKLRCQKTKDLPFDIIIDILTRLPARCLVRLHSLTTSSSFLARHHNQAAPQIAFCYRFMGPRGVFVNLSDATGKQVTTTVEALHYHFLESYKTANLIFYGSYAGFLVFVSHRKIVHIRNLITSEKIRVNPPDVKSLWGSYYFCGFYFHPASMNYKLLFRRYEDKTKPVSFSFWTYNISSGSRRQVASGVHHPPDINTERLPTMIDNVLYWMVSDENYKYCYGGRSDCLHSIILFDINSECFHTMSHPGGQCGLIPGHGKMGLMQMEGNLAFCDASSDKILVIWLLQDCKHKVWIRRHVIELETLMTFCGINRDSGSDICVTDFYMFNKELLLRVANHNLVLCNLDSGTFRSVGESVRKSKEKDLRVLGVPHVSSIQKISHKQRRIRSSWPDEDVLQG